MAGRNCPLLPTDLSTLSLPSQSATTLLARPAAPRAGSGGVKCLHGFALAFSPRCSYLPPPPLPPSNPPKRPSKTPPLTTPRSSSRRISRMKPAPSRSRSSRSGKTPTPRCERAMSRAPQTSMCRSSASRRMTRRPGAGSPISGSRSRPPMRMTAPPAVSGRRLRPISPISARALLRKKLIPSSCSPPLTASAASGGRR